MPPVTPATSPTASPTEPPSSPRLPPARPPTNIEPSCPRGLNWPAAITSSAIPSRASASCTACSIPSSDIAPPSARGRSAVAVPGSQVWLRIDRPAVHVDLEVEMAADGPCVPRLPDGPDDLTHVDELTLLEARGMEHVGVPVLPPLPQPSDDDVVAVEASIVGALHHGSGGGGSERRATARHDVEALVPAAAVPGRPELTDRPTSAVRASHRKEVTVQRHPPGLLLASPGDRDDDSVAPVGDRTAPVVEAVPTLDPIAAGVLRGQRDPPHLLAPAGDPDRHVGGRRSADPERDPDAVDRVREASARGD